MELCRHCRRIVACRDAKEGVLQDMDLAAFGAQIAPKLLHFLDFQAAVVGKDQSHRFAVPLLGLFNRLCFFCCWHRVRTFPPTSGCADHPRSRRSRLRIQSASKLAHSKKEDLTGQSRRSPTSSSNGRLMGCKPMLRIASPRLASLRTLRLSHLLSSECSETIPDWDRLLDLDWPIVSEERGSTAEPSLKYSSDRSSPPA